MNPANNRLTAGVYDGRGNLTSVGAQRYDYDGLSRQTALNGGYERYLYDGAGERFARLTAPSVGTKLFTIEPCRLLDTRFSPPAIFAPRAVQLTGNCGVPSGATGVVGNLAAIPYASGGFLTAYPTGTNPATSTLNFNAAQVRANNFQIAVSGNGQMSLSASTTVDAIVDVVGYFAHDAPTWTLTMRDEANRLATEYSVPPPLPPPAGGPISRVKNYLYLGNLLAATRNSAGQYTYYASDHLGTPRATTGALTESHKYQPFGTEITSSFGNQPLKFAAMERDLSSANDFVHARYQSSLLGRFLSPDLIAGIPEEPQSWNRYSYTLNNPLKYVDPTGLLTVTVSSCTALQICAEETVSVTAKDPLREEHEALLTQARQELVLQDLREHLFVRQLTDQTMNHPAMSLGMGGLKRVGPGLGAARVLPLASPLAQRVQETVLRAITKTGRFRRDGTLYENSYGNLPRRPEGYYSRWSVEGTPGKPSYADRIVVGKEGEVYFSPIHYKSFVRIQ